MKKLCSARGRRHNISKILDADSTDLEIFTAIAREMLVRNARDTELTRLLWFTALESHTLSQRFFRTFIAVYYEELATYIRRRVREGAFRNVESAAIGTRVPGHGGLPLSGSGTLWCKKVSEV